jgi:hypothetical protein
MGRPRKFATASERQAAYRSRYATPTIRVLKETDETVRSIAAELDVPATEVYNSLINYALLNRNWRDLGLFGKMLPRAENPIDLEP